MSRRPPRTRPLRAAFTLIELLVVVTIIALLIALLAPALDRAISEAQMVVCMSKLKGIANGAQVYASNFNRRYPHRTAVAAGSEIEPHRLNLLDSDYDLRPIVDPFLDVNSLLDCPMTGKVDYEGSDADTSVFSNYGLWFGWRYTGQPSMFKLGDRFGWGTDRFSVLAGDDDLIDGDTLGHNSHPDENGVYVEDARQDWVSLGADVGGVAVGTKVTYSAWVSTGTQRGPVDMNFGFDDSSVLRFDRVEWELNKDERLAPVPPYVTGAGHPTTRIQLPPS